jgi:hypothetical protein
MRFGEPVGNRTLIPSACSELLGDICRPIGRNCSPYTDRLNAHEEHSKIRESAPEFQQAIERAIFAENELLIRMRDELLDEREGQLEIAMQALSELRTDPVGSSKVAGLLGELIEGLQGEKNLSVSLTLIEGGQNMTTVHGGHYENTDSQILAQGPDAQATGNTVYRQQLEVDLSDPELAVELKAIKEHLLGTANTSTDFEAIAGVQGAIEAIEAKDEESAVSYLKRAGGRALEIAIDVGAKLAQKAIEASVGAA